jgi:hypothetical protein
VIRAFLVKVVISKALENSRDSTQATITADGSAQGSGGVRSSC